MMILIRFLLVSLIVYLLIRSFLKLGKAEGPVMHKPESGKNGNATDKKVSKEIGEYIDYEEIKEKER
jgi:large-conductance mechanosensitive channel